MRNLSGKIRPHIGRPIFYVTCEWPPAFCNFPRCFSRMQIHWCHRVWMCECKREPETANRFLLQCLRWVTEQAKMLTMMKNILGDNPSSLGGWNLWKNLSRLKRHPDPVRAAIWFPKTPVILKKRHQRGLRMDDSGKRKRKRIIGN